jgi:peroxiredoxin
MAGRCFARPNIGTDSQPLVPERRNSMSLRDALAESRPLFDSLDSNARYAAIAKVVAVEQEKRIRRVGDEAPTFNLEHRDRGLLSSTLLLKEGPLVVSFYRGLWCPYCERDIGSVDEIMGAVNDSNASVIAIAHQVHNEARKQFAETHNSRFSLLDDVEGTIAEQFGIRWAPEDSELIEKEFGWDIVTPQGSGPWILPMQARYVIAPNNRIVFAEVAFNYDESSAPSSILPYLTDRSHTSSTDRKTDRV